MATVYSMVCEKTAVGSGPRVGMTPVAKRANVGRLSSQHSKGVCGSSVILRKQAGQATFGARSVMSSVKCAGGAASASEGTKWTTAQDLTRETIRIAIPSKGRMAEDTQDLLKSCQLNVRKLNPRQYIAKMPSLDGVEVWFQRASDVVRRLRAGDVDLGILGNDMYVEFGEGDPDLIVIHDALDFGHCHLALGVPNSGRFAHVESIEDLKAMPEFTETNPLRVVTGYHYVARKFFSDIGFEHVVLLNADGALEALPQMGSADIILDLVSTGTTMKENNLREIEGGKMLESEGILVARKSALLQRPGTLDVVREMIERLEAHMQAQELFTVVANMRGDSQEHVAQIVLEADQLLQGLQGPTVSRVFTRGDDGKITDGAFYAITIMVPKKKLYDVVKQIRALGGSGVIVSPCTYVYEEEPARWTSLLEMLGIDDYDEFVASQAA